MFGEFWNGILVLKKLYSKKMESLCEKYGLSRMEADILLFLSNHPEEDTAKAIVEKRRFTKSHVSAAVKSLEQKGYITRNFHEGNKKTVHLSVLETAEEIVRDGQKVQIEFGKIIFESFDKKDMERMEHNFRKILASAQRALKEEESCCTN